MPQAGRSSLDEVDFFNLPNPSSRAMALESTQTPLTEDQPVTRPLPIHRMIQTQNKCTQTSMPRVGLEPTIPVFERAKTVHA
jgi:hypothetical protein